MVSVVIAAEPSAGVEDALKALDACGYPRRRMEVLVCRGRNPSLQRNLGVAGAKGDFVLFLDSDSRAQPGLVAKLLGCFDDARVAAAGGPDLPLTPQTLFQSCFDQIQSSWFGSFSSRARYRPLGPPRASGEEELILCNLMVRRSEFLKSRGFRTGLFPNEENEWLDRMRSAGKTAWYQPEARVRRPRHTGVPAFAGQAFRYGRGRSRQMLFSRRLNPFHLLPALFLAYLAGLPALYHFGQPVLWPLAAYLVVDLVCSLAAGALFPFLLLLYPLRHVCYGLGIWSGLFFRSPRPEGKVEISHA